MSSIGELFGFEGGPGNDTPFDAATLDNQLDQILATRPIAGAPDGYVSPQRPQAPQGDGVGAAGGMQDPAAPVAPEAPAAPPPFAWPPGPASAYPPAAPASPTAPPQVPPPAAPAAPAPPPGPPAVPAGTPDPFAGLSDLERFEAAQVIQALRDPDRAPAVRRAYIGAPEPIGGVPAAPPPAAPPFAIGMPPVAPPAAAPVPVPAPAPLPEGVDEGTPEALIIRTQQEQARQLEEIRAGVAARDQQTEEQLTVAAAGAAVQAFTARYGDRLTQAEIDWLCQTAGYQRLPDAFRNSNPNLTREAAFTQALEFQLRSTDQLFTKIVSGPPGAPATAPPGAPPATPPAAPAPVVYPGQTPQADARHRYLTALSSAASPSGDAPQRTPLAHRPDGKLDERSRMQLVQEMTSGGTMGELMGPN